MAIKIPCKECGALILPSTVKKTNGICMPCKRGESMGFFKKLFGLGSSRRKAKKVSNKLLDVNTDLFKAADDNDTARIERLLTNHAHVNVKNKNGEIALTLAARKGNTTAMQALLAAGADVNAKNFLNQTALMYATNPDIVKALLTNGADVNAKDRMGATALMAAVGRSNIVLALLEGGADPNLKAHEQATALMVAAQGNHSETVQILLDGGADPNLRTDKGSTALIIAANEGNAAIVQTLLTKGADVNAKSNEGGTALIEAARKGHTDVVQALLDKGADVNARDNYGQSALMDALEKGHHNIIQLLENALEQTDHQTLQGNLSSKGTDTVGYFFLPSTHETVLKFKCNPTYVPEGLDYIPVVDSALGELFDQFPNRKIEVKVYSEAPDLSINMKISDQDASSVEDMQIAFQKILRKYQLQGPISRTASMKYEYSFNYTHRDFFARMSKSLVHEHGPIIGIDFLSHFPKFEIEFRYADGTSIYSGERTEMIDIHYLTFGYYGDGPTCLGYFLDAAGFKLDLDKIKTIKPGDTLRMQSERTIVSKKKIYRKVI